MELWFNIKTALENVDSTLENLEELSENYRKETIEKVAWSIDKLYKTLIIQGWDQTINHSLTNHKVKISFRLNELKSGYEQISYNRLFAKIKYLRWFITFLDEIKFVKDRTPFQIRREIDIYMIEDEIKMNQSKYWIPESCSFTKETKDWYIKMVASNKIKKWNSNEASSNYWVNNIKKKTWIHKGTIKINEDEDNYSIEIQIPIT